MNEEIVSIKKNGRLIALDQTWQYWLKDDILYSLRVDGMNYNIWCGIGRLNAHLHRLLQITGKRFFTENPDMVVIDKDFVGGFRFA